MSVNTTEDSQMLSSPDESESEQPPQRHLDHTPPPTASRAWAASEHTHPILSPPGSQQSTRTMPTVAPGASVANSNGKRPLQTISNGNDDAEEIAAMAHSKARQEFPPKTHTPSGYTWNRVEDEPGYAWTNKKALDEYHRAYEALVHKELVVKNRYGDPFDLAQNEQALLATRTV